MRSYLAAAVQMTASSSKEENLAKAETFVRLAAERGAALVVLPEVFSWRGPRAEEPAQVEPIPGPTAERLQELARRHQVHEHDQLAVGRREEEPLRAPLGPFELPSFERRKRRVEGL